ncbi:MAG: ABC transporter permease, partial [Shewanellaceae bacterium]|nr:ABC transporter permease [Shewanellaceae bacterium]
VIILGFVIGGVCRGVTVGALVTLVAANFTDITIYNLPVIIVTVIMTAVLFALGGLLNALFAKTFDDITMIPTFVLTPLTYLGGVFYSLELLNEFWQSVSYLNPLVYMITTFRYGFLGIEDIDWGYSLGLISLFIVIFYSLTHILLSRGIGLKE